MQRFDTFTSQRTSMYYDLNTEAIEDTLAWAEMFENTKARVIGQCRTLYGEKLSTVWLGIDHQFGSGPPLIFETMLFAPCDAELRRRVITRFPRDPDSAAAYKAEEEHIRKHYPHDQLQLRYTWKDDARESFEKLRLQCLVPPRWRRFIFYKIFKDEIWN